MTTKSAFDFTLTDPTAASGAAAGSASTSKLAVGDDYIDAPILSKTDWKRGEPIKDKHDHDAEKHKRKRDRVKGEVMDVGFGIGEFVKRNWKWIVPLLVFLSVVCVGPPLSDFPSFLPCLALMRDRVREDTDQPPARMHTQRHPVVLLPHPAHSDHHVRFAKGPFAGILRQRQRQRQRLDAVHLVGRPDRLQLPGLDRFREYAACLPWV